MIFVSMFVYLNHYKCDDPYTHTHTPTHPHTLTHTFNINWNNTLTYLIKIGRHFLSLSLDSYTMNSIQKKMVATFAQIHRMEAAILMKLMKRCTMNSQMNNEIIIKHLLNYCITFHLELMCSLFVRWFHFFHNHGVYEVFTLFLFNSFLFRHTVCVSFCSAICSLNIIHIHFTLFNLFNSLICFVIHSFIR